MKVRDDHLQYFATDLTDFLACRHLSTLERLSAHGVLKRPFTDDPMLEVLRARGLEHEAQYVATLRASGKSIVEISKNDPAPFAKTLTALRGGIDVVVQARLEHEGWAGWADVLLRVPGQSAFGDGVTSPLRRNSRRKHAVRRSCSFVSTRNSCARSKARRRNG